MPPVLVLASGLSEHGGIERVTRDLLSTVTLERRGVEWASLWGAGADHRTEIGGRVAVYEGPRSRGRAASRQQILRMAASIARRSLCARYDGVICTHVALLPLGVMAAKLAGGAPVAVIAHGTESWKPFSGLRAGSFRKVDRVWSVSSTTDDELLKWQGLEPSRLRRLTLGLPMAVESRGEERGSIDGRVLAVARLNRKNAYKGVDTLLDAWPEVVRSCPSATLHIVGDGDMRHALENHARFSGLRGSIRFLGAISDQELGREYAEAMVFCLPSRAAFHPSPVAEGEGFGLVYLEAAAAGLPVVAGDVGGARDAVVNGVTGLLVDPTNSADVSQALVELLSNHDLARQLGDAGRERVKRERGPDAFRQSVLELVTELCEIPHTRVRGKP